MTITRYAYDFLDGLNADKDGLLVSYADYLALAEQVRQLTEQRDSVVADIEEMKSVIAENWNMRDVLRQILNGRPGGVYFNKWEPVILKALNELTATSAFLDSLRAEGVERAASERWGSGYVFDELNEFARQLRESKGAQL